MMIRTIRFRLPALMRLAAAGAVITSLATSPVMAQQSPESDDGAASTSEVAAQPPVISTDNSGILGFLEDGPAEPAGTLTPISTTTTAETADTPLSPTSVVHTLERKKDADRETGAAATGKNTEAKRATSAARAQPSGPAPSPPLVVVELFTSQGCAPCLSADALLADIAGRDDVLPLGFHIDYWDYLGWPDKLARPEFTARQQAYARVNGEHGVYSPQIIVDGIDTMLNAAPAPLSELIRHHLDRPDRAHASIRRDGARLVIDLAPAGTTGTPAAVELVRYLPTRRVTIAEGENHGKTVKYVNVVLSIDTVAQWDGKTPIRVTVTPRGGAPDTLPEDTHHAVLVQRRVEGGLPGRIVAAVRLD